MDDLSDFFDYWKVEPTKPKNYEDLDDLKVRPKNHEDLDDIFNMSYMPMYEEYLQQIKKIPIRFLERYIREQKIQNLNKQDIT